MKRIAASLIPFIVAGLSGCGIVLETEPWEPPPQAAAPAELLDRAACASRVTNRQPLFGDLHIHTGLSMDARALGTVTSPDDAYRFARGESIEVSAGLGAGVRTVKIDRPLDFAAVTDHAEWLAEVSLCTTPGSESYDSHDCQVFRGEATSWLARALGLRSFTANLSGLLSLTSGRSDEVCGADDARCRARLASVWQDIQASAERNYDRSSECRFTTFHAYEYSRSPRSSKIHRNVIFRNEIVPELPVSSFETPHEKDLRVQIARLCNDSGSGCDAIAIPHNPNLSNGQMFALWYRDLPEEAQRAEAQLRARLEPIVEMTQIKGSSECRNGMYQVLGGTDELCEYEKIRDMGQPELEDCGEGESWGAQAGKGCTSRVDYARYALILGLREKARIGVNPFAFGFIGSTDNHMSVPGSVSERDVPYKFGISTEQLLTVGDRKRAQTFWNPGGLAGVWAEENSRDAIFDAFERREAFATTGPRIAPRFFGGFGVPTDACAQPDFAAAGYASGVPMGGDLPEPPAAGAAPTFAVSALRDPGTPDAPGGLLQRIQIIKGWVDDDGAFHQAVHEVAGEPANGASVDLATCEPEGTGADALCGTWTDPDFDPARSAIYYARVVENPSCRWSTWVCNALPEAERPDGCDHPRVPKTIQERAFTSPIWYTAPAS